MIISLTERRRRRRWRVYIYSDGVGGGDRGKEIKRAKSRRGEKARRSDSQREGGGGGEKGAKTINGKDLPKKAPKTEERSRGCSREEESKGARKKTAKVG